ncbi:MAG: DinB family protein [Pseudomonadota bacterium]
MISSDWVRMMARYNAWQNGWMIEAFAGLSHEQLTADRGLFFGSILGTANHLLWGDLAWLNRLGAGDPPPVGADAHTRLTPDAGAWSALRRQTDQAIRDWANTIPEPEGDVIWRSALTGRDNRTPRPMAISHLFLHGVHHRGQIHAGLTALGVKTADTDLPLMPETVA